LPYLTLRIEKEVETINGGLKFQEKTQENEFLVKKKKECGRNLKNTRNLEKNERGR
jgi:hypothetical protein